jgi:hypothetical protein
VFASLLSQIEIDLDLVTTPRGMVTDNSQLVLRADRMLFSRGQLVHSRSVPSRLHDYTPPHDNQAGLLIGTKIFNPTILRIRQAGRTQLVDGSLAHGIL